MDGEAMAPWTVMTFDGTKPPDFWYSKLQKFVQCHISDLKAIEEEISLYRVEVEAEAKAALAKAFVEAKAKAEVEALELKRNVRKIISKLREGMSRDEIEAIEEDISRKKIVHVEVYLRPQTYIYISGMTFLLFRVLFETHCEYHNASL